MEKKYQTTAQVLSLLGQPNRLRIVLALGEHEACVCHLETCLAVRQATLSQHLMALREAGLVTANRDGRNMYYRLASPEILAIIVQAAAIAGTNFDEIKNASKNRFSECPCPRCHPEKSDCL